MSEFAAHKVLQDSKYAISAYSDDLQAEDLRIAWIAIITLLRAVGHVLHNVDEEKSQAHKNVIAHWWKNLNKTKPRPEIFWEFIEVERNRFLKEYNLGIKRIVEIPSGVKENHFIGVVVSANGGCRISGGRLLSSVITSGHFSGKTDKEVAWQAYDWWKQELGKLHDGIYSLNE